MPTKFGVGTNEAVLWVIGNTSGEKVLVRLDTFIRQVDKKKVDPLIWILSDAVTIDDGQIGFISGVKDPNYKHKLPIDQVKYTIHVEAVSGTFPSVDHDPDGDIKP